MAVTTYRAANFQDTLTLNMAGGTGTGNSVWTLNQSTADLPSGTFKALVYTTTGTFITTREIVQCSITGANTVTTTVRGDESTTAYDHPNGSFFAVVNTAGMENAQNDAIADLYLNANTAIVTAGEAIAATTTVGAVTLPTLVYQSSVTGKWLKTSAATATPGWAQNVAMAYEAAAGDGSTFRVYLPGSIVTGTGMTSGAQYFTSATAGGLEAFSTTTTLYYKLMGSAINSTQFDFFPTSNTTLNSATIQSYFTCGEALTRFDLCYVKISDGLVYKADADAQESGQVKNYLVCNYATSASGQTSRFYTMGATTNVNGTYATGNVLYPSGTAGQVTATRGSWSRPIGIALSSSSVYLFPGETNENLVIESVLAHENWTAGDLLYQQSSDGRWAKADADAAESGICEKVAFAFATHTGGDGSRQLIYLPGSVIRGVFTATTGNRYYPSATAAALQATTPASYDTFYRQVASAPETNVVHLNPQEMQFLPTGIQEKGFVAAGEYAQTGQTVQMSVGVNFNKIMVSTPSSITLTSSASQYAGTPTANNISRFGFRFFVAESANPGNQQTYWAGTYQTVGN